MDRPVHLTMDEAELIVAVARFAMKKLGQPELSPRADGLLRSVAEMQGINASSFAFFPMRRAISREDLVFLAPYIDDWINEQAPPQNLPAEYWDWRPEALRAFKERMQQEGLWAAQPS
jgi:hypothetical protein